jgi:hypothetical protein
MGVINGKLNGNRALVVAILSGILGGTGGPWLLVRLGGDTILRPDPFTGSQGKVLAYRVEELERHVENHPDRVGLFERRITTIETQNAIIMENQKRIIERLDSLARK